MCYGGNLCLNESIASLARRSKECACADVILKVWTLGADFMRANSCLFQRFALAGCTLLD